jgi:hypothetical protein
LELLKERQQVLRFADAQPTNLSAASSNRPADTCFPLRPIVVETRGRSSLECGDV